MKVLTMFAVNGALVVLQLSMVYGAAILEQTSANTFWSVNPNGDFDSSQGMWKVPRVIIPFKKLGLSK